MGKSLKVLEKKFALYDEYYRRGQAILDKYNPCNISADGKTCTGGQPCCSNCGHLGDKGCTVQALGCKLWLCYSAEKENPECFDELMQLAKEAEADGIPMGYRTSKKESFEPSAGLMYLYNNKRLTP